MNKWRTISILFLLLKVIPANSAEWMPVAGNFLKSSHAITPLVGLAGETHFKLTALKSLPLNLFYHWLGDEKNKSIGVTTAPEKHRMVFTVYCETFMEDAFMIQDHNYYDRVLVRKHADHEVRFHQKNNPFARHYHFVLDFNSTLSTYG